MLCRRLLPLLFILMLIADTGVLCARFRVSFRARLKPGQPGYQGSSGSTGPQFGVVIGLAFGTILLVALVGSSWCAGSSQRRTNLLAVPRNE